MRKSVYLVVATAVALLVAGCGADPDLTNSGASAPGGHGAPAKVVALDNVFGDGGADVRVEPGSKVTWVNQGHNDHNIVPVGTAGSTPAFGVAAERFTPGATHSYTFDKPGVFAYYCSLHGTKSGGMRGRVLVGDVQAPPVEPAPATDVAAAASGNTVKVPADQPTIQKAVDAAAPGDLILISPGVYKEAVDVPETKPYLTIRGLDRNRTILDGGFELANGFKVVKAKGVAIENLTARNFTKNGFFWTGAEGYRGSYLTAIRNGDYGIYSFESTKGQLDHSYASGSPDAGFYIGGCQPCDALVTDVTSEWNGLGYSGTNAGGNLVIANSVWRYNRAGIVPNSGSYEPNAPQRGNQIVGNLVYDNNNGKTPAIDVALNVQGSGIVIAGGQDNVIERNRVVKHGVSGILVFTYPESGDYVWDATGNIVRGNAVSESGGSDLTLWFDGFGSLTGHNCFQDNEYETSQPAGLEAATPCEGKAVGDLTKGIFDIFGLARVDDKPASVDYRKAQIPAVPDQVNLPDAASAPGHPAIDVPAKLDLAAIELPAAP